MNNQTLIVKLSQIKDLLEECLGALSNGKTEENESTPKKEIRVKESNYILLIINKIKNCDEAEKIEKEILDKTAMSGRILLPFYICHKYFPEQGLTTGDVAKITLDLGAKVQVPNVSKAISKSLLKYLDGNSTRAKGKIMVYKLNRKGAKYFESILNLDEKQ